MKKILMFLLVALSFAFTSQAQTDVKVKTAHTESKSKPTKSVKNRVHNAIHPHHKQYSGHKTKKKTTK